jgi:hypothetical protein
MCSYELRNVHLLPVYCALPGDLPFQLLSISRSFARRHSTLDIPCRRLRLWPVKCLVQQEFAICFQVQRDLGTASKRSNGALRISLVIEVRRYAFSRGLSAAASKCANRAPLTARAFAAYAHLQILV